GSEVNETQLGIDCRCLPHAGATVLPCIIVARPSVVADLAGAGNGEKGPDEVAVFRVIRFDAASSTVLATCKTDDYQTVVIKRCGRDRITLLPRLCLNGPNLLTRLFIQSHQPAIELSDINSALTYRQPAAGPTAADGGDLFIEVRLVFPVGLACFHTDGKDVVGSCDDIDEPVVNDGLRLTRVFCPTARTVQMRSPNCL